MLCAGAAAAHGADRASACAPPRRGRRLLAAPGPRFVVFSSDAEGGVYWCPDCVRVLPAIKRTMQVRAAAWGCVLVAGSRLPMHQLWRPPCSQEKGASLLEVLVGPRAVWKDPGHPLRKHPGFQVGGVPTLVAYGPGGPGARLGAELEGPGASPGEVVALVARFVGDNPA